MAIVTSEPERIIKKSSSEWVAKTSKKDVSGRIILTNKRLYIADISNSFLLQDIIDVEISSSFADPAKIVLILKNKETDFIEFINKDTIGKQILLGTDPQSADVSIYAYYWASLITMAVFLYGPEISLEDLNKKMKEEKEEYEKSKEKKAYCHDCGKYVAYTQNEDDPVWKIPCPICGKKGMTSLSPEDMKNTK